MTWRTEPSALRMRGEEGERRGVPLEEAATELTEAAKPPR